MYKRGNGFTLIELLAVIIILGIIMIIAVPGVSSYIIGSRKSAMIQDANVYLDYAIHNASFNNLLPNEAEETETFSVCDAKLEKDVKKSPFGAYWVCDKSYVEIRYDGTAYSYKIQLLDESGNYLPLSTRDELDEDIIIQINDKNSVPGQNGDNNPTLISQLTVANIGDYVDYDAGTWDSTVIMPNGQGQFGGYEEGTSRGTSVTCYDSAANNSSGWRILSINDGTVKLISAGTPECYHHTSLKVDSEMILIGNLDHYHTKYTNATSSATPHDWSYYINSKYATKATIFTRSMITGYCNETGNCASGVTDDNVFFLHDNLIKTGANYWLGYANTLNPYNPYLWIVRQNGWVYDSGSNFIYGVRPVITLKPEVKGTFENGVWNLS